MTYVGRKEEEDWFNSPKAGFDDSKTELEATWLNANIRKVFSNHRAQ